MGRPTKPLHEIVRTAGISLTEAEQERIAQCALHWDTSKSAAGRSLFLMGLAIYDLMHSMGIALPQQSAILAQSLPRQKATRPADPVSRHAQRPEVAPITARGPATPTGPESIVVPLLPSAHENIEGRPVDTLRDLQADLARYEDEAAAGNKNSARLARERAPDGAANEPPPPAAKACVRFLCTAPIPPPRLGGPEWGNERWL